MDEAVARLKRAPRGRGVIAGLDADCRCDADYLERLVTHFRDRPRTPGCSVYFEHPLSGPLDARLYEGIARYELFLRYYVHGLRAGGFPYAHHTVGSCMAVRSEVYEKLGGMNRRRAGEDFYFLQKVIAAGGYSDLNDTRVIPSPRVSGRVPFGTGRAMSRWMSAGDGSWMTYSPRVFGELKQLGVAVGSWFDDNRDAGPIMSGLPDAMAKFLAGQGFAQRLDELRANAASRPKFVKRFYRWFNAFRALKFIHWASANHYPEEPLHRAAASLVGMPDSGACIVELLNKYRDIDRAAQAHEERNSNEL
jgi:hypothetical protein